MGWKNDHEQLESTIPVFAGETKNTCKLFMGKPLGKPR
jgi:hypothetical protein